MAKGSGAAELVQQAFNAGKAFNHLGGDDGGHGARAAKDNLEEITRSLDAIQAQQSHEAKLFAKRYDEVHEAAKLLTHVSRFLPECELRTDIKLWLRDSGITGEW